MHRAVYSADGLVRYRLLMREKVDDLVLAFELLGALIEVVDILDVVPVQIERAELHQVIFEEIDSRVFRADTVLEIDVLVVGHQISIGFSNDVHKIHLVLAMDKSRRVVASIDQYAIERALEVVVRTEIGVYAAILIEQKVLIEVDDALDLHKKLLQRFLSQRKEHDLHVEILADGHIRHKLAVLAHQFLHLTQTGFDICAASAFVEHAKLYLKPAAVHIKEFFFIVVLHFQHTPVAV